MKLSIIITFYQYKKYLEECLHSLKTSTFHDFETILVLDPAHEEAHSVYQEYEKDLNMRVLYSLKHGVNACRNLGMQQAKGEYIYFLDSDDYVLENTLENLVMQMDGSDIICGTVKNTWNNKVNFIEKQAKKLEDLDEEEQEMIELDKQQKIDDFVQKYAQVNQNRMQAYYHLFKKKRGVNNITILGSAYRRKYMLEQGILFPEDMVYYGDFPTIVSILSKASIYSFALDAEYIKRRHNDPINYPALRQVKDDNRFYEHMHAFELARKEVKYESVMRKLIDRKIINYYLNVFIKHLRRSEDDRWRQEYYPYLSSIVKDCRPDAIKEYRLARRKMVYSLQENNLDKTLKQVRNYLGLKKLKKIRKNKNVLYKLAYYHKYLKEPLLDNVVIFETFNGKNYSDSPKYIYEYLAKNYGDKFECVWALNNGTKPPYGAKVVKRFSFQYAYYLARAKYLVFNVRPPLWYRKREGQVFLETWHGTPLKRLVFDQEEVTAASPKYKQQFYKQRQDWDYLISANDFSTETLARCFMYEGEMLDYGYPRNDLMYAENKGEIAKNIKNKLGIPLDKKTILYAPTWRDDEYYGKGQYKFTLKLDLNLLRQRLGNEYVILLRTHQYIADALDITGLEGFAYNVSKYDDITELYLISDICITDYSSVFFDFANLRRPILFYTYDIEKYKSQLRGFYIDMNTEVPGPLLYTSEEVISAIEHIDEINEKYKDRYDTFYKRFCHLDDGNASKRVVERVFFGKKKDEE